MSYYDPSLNSLIITDASPTGVSAILLQQWSDSSYRITAYSSRTLTTAEQSYSQLVRECLAIVHAFENFRVYILGGHFQIVTDHLWWPLVHLFKNAQSRMPLWIERWSLHLQEFDFTISHIKGTVNPVDFLSRQPCDIKTKTVNITEQYRNFVQNHVCTEAFHCKRFEIKQKKILLCKKLSQKCEIKGKK